MQYKDVEEKVKNQLHKRHVHHNSWYVAEEDILTFASPQRKFDSSSEDNFGCQILRCYLYAPGSYRLVFLTVPPNSQNQNEK